MPQYMCRFLNIDEMQIGPSLTSILCWWFGNSLVLALPRSKDYNRDTAEVAKNGIGAEPSCEELKAMWRFSKRQSRAAEITNEIPMYKDPFSENVWEPYYATSRSLGGMRLGRYKEPPIYGRLIHKAPSLRIQDIGERNRAFEELANSYGRVHQSEPRRRPTAFRLSGGSSLSHLGYPPQTGSFQHLKELIRTERARDLHDQRIAEETAARALALKELAGVGNHRSQTSRFHENNYNYEMGGPEDDEDVYISRNGIIQFPDLLARSGRQDHADIIEDYGYHKIRPRTQDSFFGSSSFNLNKYDGLIV